MSDGLARLLASPFRYLFAAFAYFSCSCMMPIKPAFILPTTPTTFTCLITHASSSYCTSSFCTRFFCTRSHFSASLTFFFPLFLVSAFVFNSAYIYLLVWSFPALVPTSFKHSTTRVNI